MVLNVYILDLHACMQSSPRLARDWISTFRSFDISKSLNDFRLHKTYFDWETDSKVFCGLTKAFSRLL